MEKSVKRLSDGNGGKPRKCMKVLNKKAESKGHDKKETKTDSLKHVQQTLHSTKSGEASSSKQSSPLIVQVARQASISLKLCETIINYFEEDCTIPFLVRYRSNKIGGKTAEELRIIKDVYKTMKQIQARASFIKKTLKSKSVLSDDLEYHIDNAQTMMELDELYEPFKNSKKTRIHQAEEIGLVEIVKNVLESRSMLIRPEEIINPKNELVKDFKTVKQLIIHISGDFMLKDIELISKLPTLYRLNDVYIVSQKNTKRRKETSEKKTSATDKFKNYYDFRKSYLAVKPHQVLAINRGEEQQELKVTVELPDSFHKNLEYFLWNKWVKRINKSNFMFDILNKAIQTEVIVKLNKKISKRIRADLTAVAEKESLKVFSSNLKWLLLTRPVCNHIVLAIDPGFTGGCKIAVVSHDQKVLDTSLFYLANSCEFVSQLTTLIHKHKVSLIAIGNGKGCREAENCVGQLIKNLMKRGTDIHYTIVSEQGVSIYSCSKEAKKEYPNLSPNFISAVSLAKRVIDPLGEMIKVQPKHLGVGMYQHDLNSKRLDEMLNEVVSEVVSMVGVNLNTAPLTLLMQVAGLTESRAKALISFRETNGPFKQRSEIPKIKGIGKKTFQQCAGFVRILPQGEDGEDLAEPLDQTIIHPEDYAMATRFIKEVCVLKKEDIGKDFFITEVKRTTELGGKFNICKLLKIDECTFDVLFEGLTKSLHYDIRMDCEEQLFKKEITTFKQLRANQIITGRVENVTHFGSFIDIGVGNSMLLPATVSHNTQEAQDKLHYGQKVLVKVMEIKPEAQKVTLSLVEFLSK